MRDRIKTVRVFRLSRSPASENTNQKKEKPEQKRIIPVSVRPHAGRIQAEQNDRKPARRIRRRFDMDYTIRLVTADDYDAIYALWNASEQSRRALNPVDDTREGIARYLKRNPSTCFAAVSGEQIVGVILTGHDGRRAIIHHMCVHPAYRRMGIAGRLVSEAEKALKEEGIQKIFGLVFKDNDAANAFWESQGYSLRTNLNYRNKSLSRDIPAGE